MNGMHLALERDDAKQLFGCRDPDLLRAFLWEDVVARLPDAQRMDWTGLELALAQRLLGDGSLSSNGNGSPLDQCFMGGRPLDAGEGRIVRMVRPDMVGHVTDALANYSRDLVSEKLNALPEDYDGTRDAAAANVAYEQIKKLHDFFQHALSLRSAVVFCCET